jgi:hypothetical protein
LRALHITRDDCYEKEKKGEKAPQSIEISEDHGKIIRVQRSTGGRRTPLNALKQDTQPR